MRVLLFTIVSLLVSAQADAFMQNARFALHRKPVWRPGSPPMCDNPSTPTVEPNYSPNYDGLPCSQYTVTSPLRASTVYIVIGQAGMEGIAAASFGIDYDGRAGGQSGIKPQFVTWTACANGLQFPYDGGFGDFPKPKGGLRVTWSTPTDCANQEVGSYGVHAVVGALYIYANGADLLRLTPNNAVSPPELLIVDCSGQYTNFLNLVPPIPLESLFGRVQVGSGSGGFTPCSQIPCVNPIATLDVDPNTMNANSGGKYITAFVELPSEYDPSQVVEDSFWLNGSVAAVPGSLQIGDANENQVLDFTMKFPRDAVEATLEEGDQVPILIAGLINETCTFTGTDVIRVIRPHLHHPNGGESYIAGAYTMIEWENPHGWSVNYAQIYYSPDSGDTWDLMADQVTGESCAWRAPTEPTESGRLRVVLVDDQGVMGYDSSDGPFSVRTSTTGIGDAIPTAHRLYQNSPNPFQSATRVAFDLPEAGKVTLKVFDLNGRVVRVLADDVYPAGTHEVSWNALDVGGKPVSAGIYFLHIAAGSFTDTKRMYLQK